MPIIQWYGVGGNVQGNNGFSGGSISGPTLNNLYPATNLAGDPAVFMMVICFARGNGRFVIDGDWKEAPFGPTIHSSSGINLIQIFWLAREGPLSTYAAEALIYPQYIGGASGDTCAATLVGYTGVDRHDPFATWGPASSNAGAANIGPIASCSAYPDAMYCLVGCRADDWSTTSLSGTEPGLVWTQRAELDSTQGNDGGFTFYSAPSEGVATPLARTITVSGGVAFQPGVGRMFALRPHLYSPLSLNVLTKRVIAAAAGGGTNVGTYTGTGGLTFAGTATSVKGKAYSATGGVSFAGTATTVKGKVFLPAGGLTFGGSAATLLTTVASSFTYTGSGGLAFAGAAAVTKGKVYRPSGGVTFAGAAAFVKGKIYTPSGGITFAGTAPRARGRVYISSGGMTFAGSATFVKGKAYTSSGGLSFTGTAPVTKGKVYSPSGGVTFAGAGAFVKGRSYIPSGGLIFAGAAATEYNITGAVSYPYTGSGGLTFAGTAVVVTGKVYTPSGGLIFDGSAAYAFQSTAAQSYEYQPTGGLTLAGAAVTVGPTLVVVPSQYGGGGGGGGAKVKKWMKESGLEDDIDRMAEKLGLKVPPKAQPEIKEVKKKLKEIVKEAVKELPPEVIAEKVVAAAPSTVTLEEFRRLEARMDKMEKDILQQRKRIEEEYYIWRALAERVI